MADLVGDASLDLALLQGFGASDATVADGTPDRVLILAGAGDGSFGAPLAVRCGRGPVTAAVGDLDRDGRPDLVVGSVLSASLTVRLSGNGTPATLEVPHGYLANNLGLRLAEATGDGLLDVLIATGEAFGVLPGR